MENPIKMDDLGVPPFSETSKYVRPAIEPSVKEAEAFIAYDVDVSQTRHSRIGANLDGGRGEKFVQL